MKRQTIHNLNTLEKEILRLQLKSKTTEEQLEKNFHYLQENYGTMFLHSFTKKKKEQAGEKQSLFESILKNEHLSATLNKLSERVADKASEHIENLVDKLFNKKS